MRRWRFGPRRRGAGCSASIVGALFVAIGLALGLGVAQWMSQGLSRAERLQPASLSDLRAAGPGQEVVVQGRIGSQTETGVHDLTAYTLEESYRDGSGRLKWRLVERRAPPLQLELEGSPVQITNSNYVLMNAPVVADAGVVVGQQVTVIGTAVSSANGVSLNAEIVAPGSKADFVQAQQSGAFWFRLIGYAMAGVGAFAFAGGLFSPLRDLLRIGR